MRICHVGLNHKTAPVELRERLAVSEDQIAPCLQQLVGRPAVREVSLLSTCNRVEITMVTHDPDAAIAQNARYEVGRLAMDRLGDLLAADRGLSEQPSGTMHLCCGQHPCLIRRSSHALEEQRYRSAVQ